MKILVDDPPLEWAFELEVLWLDLTGIQILLRGYPTAHLPRSKSFVDVADYDPWHLGTTSQDLC